MRRPTIAERAAHGRAARQVVPRSHHGRWEAPADRADPVGLLEVQARTRIPELVPIRHGRMLVSAFAYYRGAALPMAADLASTPDSGLEVQLCGDAHLSNFGVFGSPERHLSFDVNDFDETAAAPGSGTSSACPRASRWRAGRTGSRATSGAGSCGARSGPTARRCAISPPGRCSTCGTRGWTWTSCSRASARCWTPRRRPASGAP